MHSGTTGAVPDQARSALQVVGPGPVATAVGRRLADAGVPWPVRAADPGAVDPGDAVGIVCLDTGSGDPASDAASVAARVAGSGVDCPVVVVGADVDAAAAYDAGATEVIPLDATDRTAVLADRIETVVERHWDHRFVSDLLDESSDGVIVHDPDTAEILACNDRFYEMLGYDPATDEIKLDDFVGHDEEFSRSRAVDLVREAAGGTPTSFEWRDPTNDGGDIWVEVKLEAADLGGRSVVVASVRDISDRKARESELTILQRAVEEASIPVTLADPDRPDTPLVYVNEAFERLTGYDADRALGRNCRFLQGPDTDPETVAELRSAIENEETITTEIRNYRADGTEFWNRLEVTPIYDDDGTLLRFLGNQIDVTELRRARAVRQQLLSTTRTLMRAETREAVARTVSEAATTILDHDLTVVWLATDDGDLEPTAWSDRVDAVLEGPPGPVDDDPFESALAAGEPVVVDDVRSRADIRTDCVDPVRSLLVVPLGDHGVLGVAATEPDAFDEEEIDRARLLTVNAASALDRVSRREDLQRYETVFETVRDKLYVIDRDGYLEMVTEPLAEELGYDREEMLGEHVSSFLTEETVEAGEALILDLIVTPEDVSSTYEGALVGRDGAETPVEIELSLLPYEENFRGTVGAVRDISRRQQREQELQGFRQAITEAGIGLAMFDDSGHFEYVNDRYARMVGRTPADARSVPVWETVGEISEGTFGTYWDSFTPGETRTEETDLQRADGSTVPVEMVTTAVEIDDRTHHVVTVREVTGRRERRQQSAVLHRIVRHNLRNDLTVVKGYADHLAEELDGHQREAAEKIGDAVDRLLGITSTARDAERLIDREIVRKPTDVAEMLRNAVADIRAAYDATVETDLPDSEYVLADTPLSLAVEHLLTNAVEHNDSDAPWVGVRTATAPDRTGWVTVEVADNGPGIPDHETAVLTAGEETSLQHGSGVGLWIVHWVVTRYGGELEFREREGGGSVVTVALPAADPPETERAPSENS